MKAIIGFFQFVLTLILMVGGWAVFCGIVSVIYHFFYTPANVFNLKNDFISGFQVSFYLIIPILLYIDYIKNQKDHPMSDRGDMGDL